MSMISEDFEGAEDCSIEKLLAEQLIAVERKYDKRLKEQDIVIKQMKEEIQLISTKQERFNKELNDIKEKMDKIYTRVEAVKNELESYQANVVDENDTRGIIQGVLQAGIDSLQPITSTPRPPRPSRPLFPSDNDNPQGESIHDKISPFYGVSSTHDRINQEQRAFVRYFFHNHSTDGVTDALIQRCITEGTEAGIWEPDLRPGDKDLSDYLKESIRNLKKKTKLKGIKKHSRERLSSYIQEYREQYQDMDTDTPPTESVEAVGENRGNND